MVDDRPENLLALEAVLTSPHYHLVSASSGEEALKCLLKKDFAVILLDVQMPGLNGFETAKLIKKREKSRHIPIIFITAISQDMDNVLQGYAVGAIDYIFKPFYPETLKRKIEQFVQIHESHEQMRIQSEEKRSIELEQVHSKLDTATLDLRKTEALARVIGETLMDTIVTFDRDGRILSVNSAVTRMFGYQAEELPGQHIMKLFTSIEQNAEENIPLTVTSFIKRGSGKVMECTALRKDRSRFFADIQIGEARIEEDSIFVCSIHDITERKQMEEARNKQFNDLERIVEERTLELILANEKLQREIEERKKIADDLYVSQDRFRKIFESSPCLIAIRSLQDGRYIDVNASWLHYTGYSYEEMKHQTVDLLKVMQNCDGDMDSYECGLPIQNMKISYMTKNKEVRRGLLSTERIEIQGEACILIVLIDITERDVLEKEMSRLDRLNLIGEMAAGIAHEIRNPMTTVRGFLQIGRMDSKHLSPKYIDLMLEELDRANGIIKEFLNLAKNKTNHKMKQSLNSIIKALFPLIQAEAMLAGKRVLLELEECPELYLDEKEIRQLVLNLSLNGLEAMDAGGQLTLKTYSQGQEVVMEIRDQGIGIAIELLDKIGTPFFTTKDNGTGLGLAVCYSIAERHHAAIKVQTNDQGTAFLIHFKS